jgi:hypothetical protein
VSQVPLIRSLAIAASPAHPPNLAYRARKPRSLLRCTKTKRRAAIDVAAAAPRVFPSGSPSWPAKTSFTIGRTSRAVETGFVERPVAEECLRADRPFDVKAVLPLTQKSLLAVSNRPSIALRGGGDPPAPVAVGKRPLAGVACDYTYRS